MLTHLDDALIKWKMGTANLMGEMEIIKLNTGERTIIEIDGTVIKDQIDPPVIDWCDKGQHYAQKSNGKYIDDMLWYCLDCK